MLFPIRPIKDSIWNTLSKYDNVIQTDNGITVSLPDISVRIVPDDNIDYRFKMQFSENAALTGHPLLVRYFCAVTMYEIGMYCSSFDGTNFMHYMLHNEISSLAMLNSAYATSTTKFFANLTKLATDDTEYMFFTIAECDSTFAYSMCLQLCSSDIYEAIGKIKLDPLSYVSIPHNNDPASFREKKENVYAEVIEYYAKTLIG